MPLHIQTHAFRPIFEHLIFRKNITHPQNARDGAKIHQTSSTWDAEILDELGTTTASFNSPDTTFTTPWLPKAANPQAHRSAKMIQCFEDLPS